MNGPKWQRARVLPCVDGSFAGFEFWVEASAPTEKRSRIIYADTGRITEERDTPSRLFATNLRGPDGQVVCVNPKQIELLPEFCDDAALADALIEAARYRARRSRQCSRTLPEK